MIAEWRAFDAIKDFDGRPIRATFPQGKSKIATILSRLVHAKDAARANPSERLFQMQNRARPLLTSMRGAGLRIKSPGSSALAGIPIKPFIGPLMAFSQLPPFKSSFCSIAKLLIRRKLSTCMAEGHMRHLDSDFAWRDAPKATG